MFVDIGDKSWGVLACQRYLGGIEGSKTLHVGDQFLSAGANDFKVSVSPVNDKTRNKMDLQGAQGSISMHNSVDRQSCRDGGITGRIALPQRKTKEVMTLTTLLFPRPFF